MNFLVGLKTESYDDMHDNHEESRRLLHSSVPVHHRLVDDGEFLMDHDDEYYIPAKSSSTSDTTSSGHDDKVMLAVSFLLISFGYMVPWTSLGSLISYYKYTYSANFYVKLYCCYYLPGLPVALLQYKYDITLDKMFGSKRTYLMRGVVCYIGMIIIISNLVNITERYALILLFSLLGVFGWLCHGTATMLASMYPSYAIASLQTGFRCPEIFTLLAVTILRLGKHVTHFNLSIFFAFTSIAIFVGLVAWVYILTHHKSILYFEAKDAQLHEYDNLYASEDNNMSSSNGKHDMRSVDKSRERISPPYEGILIQPSSSASSTTSYNSIEPSIYVDSILLSSDSQPLGRAKRLLYTQEDTNLKVNVLGKVLPLQVALCLTIFASIFQASFFAYVDSTGSLQIEQVLYFTRLFSDLLGRPLTRLPRPWFLKSKENLMIAAGLRACSMLIFFCYILIPSFPQNDVFIISYVAVFSMLSGYFTVLIYEFASKDFQDKSSQTYATTQLNIFFQIAAFTAVLGSVYFTNAGWFDKFLT